MELCFVVDGHGRQGRHPCPLGLRLNHRNDLTITGQTGNTVLRNYAAGQRPTCAACVFTRRAVFDGSVRTDTAPPGGGFSYDRFSISVKNVIQRDSPDEA
jgi:hypothetical protein